MGISQCYLSGQVRRHAGLGARLADENRRHWQPSIHEDARRETATSTSRER